MSNLPVVYQCPGESQPISRAVHLARLSEGFRGCRSCNLRDNDALLSTRRVARVRAAQQRQGETLLWHDEGLAGVHLNAIDSPVVRRAAAALAVWASAQPDARAPDRPTIVVACDGRLRAAPLVAAAVEGIRRAGCRAIELSPSTAPCMAAAVVHLAAQGGLLLGNLPSQPHTVSLSFFGPEGRPLSAGASLDGLRAAYEQPQRRQTRRQGPLDRLNFTRAYRAPLTEAFHGLRPLRLALATACQPLQNHIEALTSSAACQVFPCSSNVAAAAGQRRSQPCNPPALPTGLPSLAALGQTVRQLRCHLGAWIDGNGQRILVVDEQGSPIAAESLAAALLVGVLGAGRDAAVVWEASSLTASDGPIACWPPLPCPALCEATFEAMLRTGAVLGAGQRGYWFFGGGTPTADALKVLVLSLVLLSQSDQPLSSVIARAAAAVDAAPHANCHRPAA